MRGNIEDEKKLELGEKEGLKICSHLEAAMSSTLGLKKKSVMSKLGDCAEERRIF